MFAVETLELALYSCELNYYKCIVACLLSFGLKTANAGSTTINKNSSL